MTGRPLLSRVGDAVYWMARYIERAENVARFIDVNFHLMLDLPLGFDEQWQPIVDISGDSAWFRQHYGASTRDNVIRFHAFDRNNPNSIISCLRAARENARSVRDTISSEMWEQVNTLFLMVSSEADSGLGMEALPDFFFRVRMGCHLFQGITDGTMSHNEAWHFIRMGRTLERADKTTRILDVKYFLLLPSPSDVGSPFDDIQWSAVLKSVSGFEMYRKKYGRVWPPNIVEFLLLDREFPRAVNYCVHAAVESLHAISGTPMGTFRNDAEQRLGQLVAELNYTRVEDVISGGLHETLDALQVKLNKVDDCVSSTFFAIRPLSADPDGMVAARRT